MKGFKEFLMRGNVFELAIAVVMGTAFTAVVTSMVTNLINPLIAAIGGSNVNGLSYQINAQNKVTTLHFDVVITAVVNFVIIAAVVYFAFVLPVQKDMARRRKPVEPAESAPTDVELLAEIRDLLRQQAGQSRS